MLLAYSATIKGWKQNHMAFGYSLVIMCGRKEMFFELDKIFNSDVFWKWHNSTS